jgi:hypothetical protein
MGWIQAVSLCDTARNPAAGKPIANNTRLLRRGENCVVRLHKTDIITIRPDNSIMLNTGGWKTITTKERMNRFCDCRIYSDRGTWYVLAGGQRYPYQDGMEIMADGTVENAGPESAPETERKLRKSTAKYAAAFVEALFTGNIGPPSHGDCWFCLMRDHGGKPLLSGDHVKSHIEENYLVPSLLTNALEMFGASQAAKQTAWAYMSGKREFAYETYGGGIIAKQITKVIRRYCLRQLGLAA